MVAERTFQTSKASWDLLKTELEGQLESIKTRCNDLANQNALLHSQFEQLQAAQRRVTDQIADASTEGAPSSDKGMEELREVVRFLRREKDILQTRLDLSLQECERATVQASHLQKSLDESRAVLDEVYFASRSRC